MLSCFSYVSLLFSKLIIISFLVYKRFRYDEAIKSYEDSLMEFNSKEVERKMKKAQRLKKKAEAEAYVIRLNLKACNQ